MSVTRTGRCNCGAVRIEARGEPVRVGICHCLACRRETGGPFMAFAVFPAEAVTVIGETKAWRGTTDDRQSCPTCGSALVSTSDSAEVEVRLGCLDMAPSDLTPTYELFVIRREPWLPSIPLAAQHERDRDG